MCEQPENPIKPDPTSVGGADLARVESAIDATNEKDRGAIRTALAKWPKRFGNITQALKDKWVQQLAEAGDQASEVLQTTSDLKAKLQAVDSVVSVVRTGGMLEGLNQADEHLQEKYDRLDRGQDTDGVKHTVFAKEAPTEDV